MLKTSVSETFWWNQNGVLQNKICLFLVQGICIYVGHLERWCESDVDSEELKGSVGVYTI
jgi:hypothetical protein